MDMTRDLMGKIFGREKEPQLWIPEMRSEYLTSSGGTAAQPVKPASHLAALELTDVRLKLDVMAACTPERLDWKHSLVDLMKLVGMDSSLAARRALADELGYTGDKSDTPQMDLWLHKQVMKKLADNGGKVPRELLS